MLFLNISRSLPDGPLQILLMFISSTAVIICSISYQTDSRSSSSLKKSIRFMFHESPQMNFSQKVYEAFCSSSVISRWTLKSRNSKTWFDKIILEWCKWISVYLCVVLIIQVSLEICCTNWALLCSFICYDWNMLSPDLEGIILSCSNSQKLYTFCKTIRVLSVSSSTSFQSQLRSSS